MTTTIILFVLTRFTQSFRVLINVFLYPIDGSEVMNGEESQQTSKPKVLPPTPVRPAPQRPSPKPPAPSNPSDTENSQQKETTKENKVTT